MFPYKCQGNRFLCEFYTKDKNIYQTVSKESIQNPLIIKRKYSWFCEEKICKKALEILGVQC